MEKQKIKDIARFYGKSRNNDQCSGSRTDIIEDCCRERSSRRDKQEETNTEKDRTEKLEMTMNGRDEEGVPLKGWRLGECARLQAHLNSGSVSPALAERYQL